MIEAPVRTINIGYGDAAIARTVEQMKQIIQRSLGQARVRQKAEELTAGVPDNDVVGEARAVYEFVRSQMRYTKDPRGLEYIQTPDHLLQVYEQKHRMSGDCDEKTVLGLSLLKNLGHPVAIKAVSFNGNGQFTHVYGLVRLNGQWVPFDATRPDQELGWEAPGITRVYEAEVDEQDLVSGLGQVELSTALTMAMGIVIGNVVLQWISALWKK